jgi:hypothetical protein
MASPRSDPNWSRLPAGTEIPELRTPTSRTYSNGDGTFTADITPSPRAERVQSSCNGADSEQTGQPLSTGQIQYQVYHGNELYFRYTPELSYVYDYGVMRVAYAKFHLTPIPDGSRIMSAEFHYYQRQYAGSVKTRITYAAVDPDSTSDKQVFLAVRDGSALAERSHPGIGWVVQTLNSDGIAHLSQCMSQGWMTLGVRPLAASGTAYGITDDDLQTYLHIVYIAPDESDIQAVRAEPLTWPVIAGTCDTALLVLTNNGLHASSQFWAYASAPELAEESTLVSSIAVGESISVGLPLPVSSKSDTFVTYRLWSACPNDPWHANDTALLTCWTFPANTHAAEGFDEPGFPPPGWLIVNNDGGNQCWQWLADEGMNHSGVGFTMSVREQGIDNNDWLISKPIHPNSNDRDSLGYFVRSYQTGSTEILYVWAMRGQAVSETLAFLGYSQPSSPSWTRKAMSLDRFDGDTIYVGFQNVSGFDWNGLCLDDIWFSKVPIPGTCEPQTTLARQPELTISPNPATGRFLTARYNVAAGSYGKLTLRDALGRTVKTFALDQPGRTRLDLRGFAPGVYFAALDAGGPSVSRKLVITAR